MSRQTVAIVDIIAERSKMIERDRLHLTLNEAVDVASILTANEFASLSLSFLVRYTVRHGLGTLPKFVSYFKSEIAPILKDIPRSESSYQFLEAQRCANIEIASVDLRKATTDRYGGSFSKGLQRRI